MDIMKMKRMLITPDSLHESFSVFPYLNQYDAGDGQQRRHDKGKQGKRRIQAGKQGKRKVRACFNRPAFQPTTEGIFFPVAGLIC